MNIISETKYLYKAIYLKKKTPLNGWNIADTVKNNQMKVLQYYILTCLYHSFFMCFLQVAEKKTIYINVYCQTTEQKLFWKNYNKEKINNYTYISYTSKWLLLGWILSGGKSSEDCLHWLIVYHLLFRWDCGKIHFMCMTEIKHNITSKEIKQIVFERIAETN